jgi:tRNA dimethylallyltransferase
MHGRLAELDSEGAARIHPNDPQRIQRALEVYLLTGKPMSAWWREGTGKRAPFEVLKLVLSPMDRQELARRAAERFRCMLAAGFLDEVRRLRGRPELHAGLPSMRAVGYRQAWRHLAGEIDHETMVREAVRATRQLAKRQLTWLRGEAGALWRDASRPGIAADLARVVERSFHLQVTN